LKSFVKMDEINELRQRSSKIIDKNPKEAAPILNEAIQKLERLLEKNQNDQNALCLLSRSLHEKAMKIETAAVAKEALLKRSEELIDKSTKVGSPRADLYCEWGSLLIDQLKPMKIQTNTTVLLQQYEELLHRAAEKFLKATEIDPKNMIASKNLSEISELMSNSPKHRMRTGKAIYFIAASLTKEGGQHKSWKMRWFVVDDSSIKYFKDKAEWESGPVTGSPAHPQGEIFFNDILDITAHSDSSKCTNIRHRPKTMMNNTPFCLHILTKDRTFNVIGFTSLEHNQEWLKTLKLALRLATIKRNVKNYLRKGSIGGSKDGDDRSKRNSVEITRSEDEGRSSVSEMLESGKMTAELLREYLSEVEDDTALVLTKSLLKSYSKKEIHKLVLALVRDNPKQFLINVSDISDFKIARFQALQKIEDLIKADPQLEP